MNFTSIADIIESYLNGLDGLKKTVARMYSELVEGGGITQPMLDALKLQVVDGNGNPSALWNKIAEFYDYLLPFGVALLIIWFVGELSRTALFQGGDMTLQSALSPFIKLVIGMLLLGSGPQIVSLMCTINNGLIEGFAQSGSKDLQQAERAMRDLTNTVDDMGTMTQIGAVVNGFIIELGGVGSRLLILFHCFARKIELAVRMPFLALALGDIYSGKESSGLKYFRKLTALAVSGFAIVGIMVLGEALASSTVVSPDPNASLANQLQPALILFAEAGMVSTAKQICNDVFGVL